MKFEEPEHRRRQAAVANKLAAAWGFTWSQRGDWCPFDVFLMSGQEIVALAEIKTAERTHDALPMLPINLDKWMPLMLVEMAMQLPAYYVVAFTDGIWGVRIGALPVNKYRITYRGRTDRPDVKNAQAPVLDVPSGALTRICDAVGVFEAA